MKIDLYITQPMIDCGFETNKVQSTVIDGSTPRWAEEMPSTVFRAIYKIW